MPPTSARRHSAPPGESDLPGAVVQPPAAVGPTEAVHHVLPAPLPSVPGPAAAAHPAATAVALAAMKAELEADKAAAQVQAASLQAQLDRQAAATQQILGLLAELRPVPAAAPPRQLPAVAGPDPLPRSGPVSGPTSASHRTAVLDRTAASAASANLFAALADGDSDDDAHEVPLHSHTRTQPTVILPTAFVPTLSGTEESAGQQLAAIFKEFGKQGGKVNTPPSRGWTRRSMTGWTTRCAATGRRRRSSPFVHNNAFSSPTSPHPSGDRSKRYWSTTTSGARPCTTSPSTCSLVARSSTTTSCTRCPTRSDTGAIPPPPQPDTGRAGRETSRPLPPAQPQSAARRLL